MFRKKQSRIIGVARARLGGLNSITPSLNFGNGLTKEAFASLLTEAETTITHYNQLLGELDSVRRLFRQLEIDLADMADRVLKAVAAYYGTSSDEYGRMGAIPKRERKRPQRSSAATVKQTTAEAPSDG